MFDLGKKSKAGSANGGFGLTVILAVLLFSGTVFGEENLEARFARADSLFQSWNIDEAILILEQLHRDNPEHESSRNLLVRAYRFKGIDLYALDRYDDAVSVWRKAIKIDARNTEINSFIGRVLMEQNLLRRYGGDFDTSSYLAAEITPTQETASAPKEPPPPKEPVVRKSPETDSNVTAPPQFTADHLAIAADSNPVVATDFHSGLAFPVGGAATGHSAGWQIGGGISFPTRTGRLRIGLEAIYARLPQAESDAPTFAGRYVSVAGVGLTFLVTMLESPTLNIAASAGTGIYETAVARQSLLLSTEDFEKDSKLGHSLGIRLEKKLLGLDFIGSARYLNLRSNLAPNLLQFSIGISAGD